MNRFLALAAVGLLLCGIGRADDAAPDQMAAAREAFANERFKLALSLLEPLAKGGSLEAQQLVGSAYHFGYGVQADTAIASEWFEKALRDADQRAAGDWGALTSLGVMHEFGLGTMLDPAKGVRYFTAAIGHHFGRAEYALGSAYYNGTGVTEDRDQAFALWKQAAEDGFAAAMTELSRCYLNGISIPKNPGIAFEWARKAATMGQVSAANLLGTYYSNGNGVMQNDQTALKWWRQAAAEGDSDALANLGWACENGRGVDQDLALAVSWEQQAADLGNAYALNKLGRYYLYGLGVEKDEDRAITLLKKAAEHGNEDAKGELAEHQMTGDDHLKIFSLTLGQPLPATVRREGDRRPDTTMWIIQPDFLGSLASAFDDLIQKAGVTTLFLKPNPKYFDRASIVAFRQLVVRIKNNLVLGVEVAGDEATCKYIKAKWGNNIPVSAVQRDSGVVDIHWENAAVVIDGSLTAESDAESVLASALVPSIGVFNATISTRELIEIKAALDRANGDAASK